MAAALKTKAYTYTLFCILLHGIKRSVINSKQWIAIDTQHRFLEISARTAGVSLLSGRECPFSGYLLCYRRSLPQLSDPTYQKNKGGCDMGHFSSMFNGLARSIKKGRNSGNCGGKEATETMSRDGKKEDLILRSSGTVNANDSSNFASAFSKRGEKGVNQDCFIVWEEFGCQEDMMFCGIFDGHGPWGHYVAKRVRETMPSSLMCNWQELLTEASLDADLHLESDKKLHGFDIWKNSYLKTCAAVDQDLGQYRKIDSFYSGTTALTIVKQGELMFVANVGDSRAVLATTSDDGSLVPVQLTVDFKPNLPQEAERIIQCEGRVFCLDDEPGVHRVWLPNEDSPGLAMSRAFGDYCVKDFGLTSVPEVTQWQLTSKDQFVVLATDGVWDVISNEEAVQIVSSTADRAKSAKSLVGHAVRAWNCKRRGIAMDDISAICLFFHSLSLSSQEIHPVIEPRE